MLNRPTVRVRYRFSELEACALKRASLRAPSSFANAETIVENQKKGMFVLPCRSCACALLTMIISKVHAAAQPRLRCLQPPVLLPVHTVMLPAP